MAHAERPLLVLPTASESEKAKRNGRGSAISRPTHERQCKRLPPLFDRLNHVFEEKKSELIALRQSSDGLEPELALVFETIGCSANFLAAVKKIEGLEWMAEYSIEGIDPSEDFFDERDPGKAISEKVYCVMSDQRALKELLSCWERYRADPTVKYERGLASLVDLFKSLKDVRTWSPADRLEDTGVIEAWSECIELYGQSPIPFEVELFYRHDQKARGEAERAVRSLIVSMGGKVHSSCVLDEIAYHALSAQLPPAQIQLLLSEDRDNIALAKADQIMFFRPTPQCMPGFSDEGAAFDADEQPPSPPAFNVPVVALLDGMPLENHSLLANRLTLDDPEGFGSSYPVKERIHGTEMASFIIHGDLNDPEAAPMERPLYVRPVMRNKFGGEGFPEGVLLVDLLHRAVRRIFEGDGDNPPTAQSVKVINISLGDPLRQHLNSVSPVARLLDWLSWKYRVLFIISAGNVKNLSVSKDADIAAMTVEGRSQAVVDALKADRRNRRLFSPAESVNSLTVGALHSDWTDPNEHYPSSDPVEIGNPSPISALGPGVARAIKPEILVPGGRILFRSTNQDGTLQWGEQVASGPGCLTACPSSVTPTKGRGYCVGTSASAALASHASGHLYEVLDDTFLLNGRAGIPEEYAALLIKAMLVHGADWSSLESAMGLYGVTRQTAARWFGYGIPDFKRVEQCAERRVTAIGCGTLKNGKAHDFRFPFPVDLHGGTIHRKLTITLASFTPTAVGRQEYRKAQVWFTLDGDLTKRLANQRSNTDWQAVLRGTLQHEIFSGDAPIPWDTTDEIRIKVSCRQGTTTGAIGAEVPYAMLVTAEVAEPIVGDLYAAVASRIRGRVNVMPQD